jgi:hypothetical protein
VKLIAPAKKPAMDQIAKHGPKEKYVPAVINHRIPIISQVYKHLNIPINPSKYASYFPNMLCDIRERTQ